MTCPTCKNENMQETCGARRRGEECPCCGMVVLAVVEVEPEMTETTENEPES